MKHTYKLTRVTDPIAGDDDWVSNRLSQFANLPDPEMHDECRYIPSVFHDGTITICHYEFASLFQHVQSARVCWITISDKRVSKQSRLFSINTSWNVCSKSRHGSMYLYNTTKRVLAALTQVHQIQSFYITVEVNK